ncbi:hypothetical protein [Methanosarcina lacustris]|nr:hypothetical protein [Methanosarcina lacustris]
MSSDFKLLDDVKQHLYTCSAGLKITPDMEVFLKMPHMWNFQRKC